MNEKIRQHLVTYAAKNNWPTDDDTLIEILTEANDLYKRKVSDSRWWYTEFIVVDIDGMLIGYEYASANRDEHVRELGWEFDPSTICEVKAVEKTVIVYERVKAEQAGEALESAALDQATGADAEEGGVEG